MGIHDYIENRRAKSQAIRLSVSGQVHKSADGFDIELLVIARMQNLKVKELPVVWDNPDGSTVSIGDYFKTLVELFRIKSNQLSGKYK